MALGPNGTSWGRGFRQFLGKRGIGETTLNFKIYFGNILKL